MTYILLCVWRVLAYYGLYAPPVLADPSVRQLIIELSFIRFYCLFKFYIIVVIIIIVIIIIGIVVFVVSLWWI